MFFKKELPSVAIIIPVYNVTTFLEEAVKSAVNQNYNNLEVIVVDDGSVFEEAENIKHICNKFKKVKLIRQDNEGPAHARDTGVKNTSAEFVVFLDGDDFLRPKAVSYLIKALIKNPDAVASYARRASIKKCGKVIKPRTLKPVGKDMLHCLLRGQFPFAYGSVCINRKIFWELPKNYHIRLGEDWVQWCYLALKGKIVFAGNRIVVFRRRHDRNISSTFLEDPSVVDEVHRIIFTDPLFMKEIGEQRLETLKKEKLSSINFYLANRYIKDSQPEKAALYFKKISPPYSKQSHV